MLTTILLQSSWAVLGSASASKFNLNDFLQTSKFNLTEIMMALLFSLIASVAVYIIYHLFYGSRNIGEGVDRSFIIIGPAITALFLGIQSSIPLSLGLLGALSFVRFRTPVKDPAEIGYLLLLIAMSIGAATHTFLVAIILFLIVFLTLSIQWLLRNRFSFRARTNLMISVDKNIFQDVEPKLTQFLKSRLRNLTMKTMSVLDDRVSIHYQHKKMPASDRVQFIAELNRLSESALRQAQGGEQGRTRNIEFFAG